MVSKINRLLQKWPSGKIATSRWMNSLGIDHRLADKYVRSGWLERLGHGAYKRAGTTVDWPDAIQALQSQLALPVHPGGITAIELRGYAHYISLGAREVILFGRPGTKLPAWFKAHPWSRPITPVNTGTFASAKNTTSTLKVDGVDIEVATVAQAIFEMMHLVPKRQTYEEAVQVMESLTTLRPSVVQALIEHCTSVKAKRLFMRTAEQAKHAWLKRLDLSKINLGSGRRTIHPGGTLDKKYELVISDPIEM
ncbi:MAG: type IV toxin-antitoxin system AbiEi family antitoxin [Ectothiorhodospiraceae bacterium AqS1]|nr:type IV toxin-antitoxin system AbiEi family antitoxin [Ectothiorhodospiraceae bacterium AqS1]